jgi:hypothetical protein
MNVSWRRSSRKHRKPTLAKLAQTVLDPADGRDVHLVDRRQPGGVALAMQLDPERLEVGLRSGREIGHTNSGDRFRA